MAFIESETIKLRRTWHVGPKIAKGGFSEIHKVTDEDGLQAVMKLVPKEPGASRELLFESVSGYPNIIPIWESGEWGDYYVLIMPYAEKSLRQRITETRGKLTKDETSSILIDMAEALAGLQRDVVHRDLKPENILFYQGHWCLADFGIARYASAATAPDTRKYAFSPRYASPEQWRFEHTTPATDIYAFGVIAFELLQGYLPFPGPDYQDQHQKQAPPSLAGCSMSLTTLITECLCKIPQERPNPANILAHLYECQK